MPLFCPLLAAIMTLRFTCFYYIKSILSILLLPKFTRFDRVITKIHSRDYQLETRLGQGFATSGILLVCHQLHLAHYIYHEC